MHNDPLGIPSARFRLCAWARLWPGPPLPAPNAGFPCKPARRRPTRVLISGAGDLAALPCGLPAVTPGTPGTANSAGPAGPVFRDTLTGHSGQRPLSRLLFSGRRWVHRKRGSVRAAGGGGGPCEGPGRDSGHRDGDTGGDGWAVGSDAPVHLFRKPFFVLGSGHASPQAIIQGNTAGPVPGCCRLEYLLNAEQMGRAIKRPALCSSQDGLPPLRPPRLRAPPPCHGRSGSLEQNVLSGRLSGYRLSAPSRGSARIPAGAR